MAARHPLAQLADDEARQQIRTLLDHSMIVEAAAGTGKTTELVERMIHALGEGRAEVGELVAVTFTEKAAGELKLRLRSEMERARSAAAPGSRRQENLGRALAHLEEARLGTIHGFCLELLRERPVEANVDPHFAGMDEAEARRLFAEAFHAWLQRKLDEPPEGVRRSLRRVADGSPAGRLEHAAWELLQWRDLNAPWRRDPFDQRARVEAVLERVQAFADLTRGASSHTNALYLDTAPARELSAAVQRQRRLGMRLDYDEIEARLVSFASARDYQSFRAPRKGYAARYGEGIARDKVLEEHRSLLEELRRFARDADADLAALLHAELQESLEEYRRRKVELSRLDFLDLLLMARDLVRDHDAVRREFQVRFRYIFVDEFQDTDPLQAEILLLLAADDPAQRNWRQVTPAPGKLFLVGDPKQAIYRFRRADIGIYQEVSRLLRERGVLHLNLTTSFRSVPGIQQAVNTAFAPLMDGNRAALQACYVPLAPYRAEAPEQPSLVALSLPRPYGKLRLAESGVEACLPDTLAAFLEWLLAESGWTIAVDGGGRARVEARHVCLLFRKTTGWFEGDVTRAYVHALEARGIPHLLVGGRSFHEREEVETLRAALTAIEWPDDELSVFAALKGSLFALGDEALFEYHQRCGPLHPYREPQDVPEHLRPVAEALELLRGLHSLRNYRPVAETLDRLLRATRAHAAFVLRPSGEQALANVLHVAELARAYEAGGGISFRGFVDRLREEAAGGGAPEAPILEEGSDGVRLMTVHKAKGLEFPVVALADVTTKLSRPAAGRYIDPQRGLCALRIAGWSPRELLEHDGEEAIRDQAEGVRLAYVAATRARDLLVIPAVGDDPRGSWEAHARWWVSPLHAAIYPEPARRRTARPAPGCPSFGDDSVLERTFDRQRGPDNVIPGMHHFGAHSVVWWDPRKLALGSVVSFGLRQKELLSKDADPQLVAADVAAYRAWQQERDAARNAGAAPSLRVARVTDYSRHGGDASAVEVISLGAPPGPPGMRYGELVHEILATIPLSAGDEQIAAVAAVRGRILGATPEEVAAATAAVRVALLHPFLRRAAQATCLRRETPVSRRLHDGTLLEGLVDLAFEENGGWVVADLKTGLEIEARVLAAYRRQAAEYAAAIAQATGKPAQAYVLRVC